MKSDCFRSLLSAVTFDTGKLYPVRVMIFMSVQTDGKGWPGPVMI